MNVTKLKEFKTFSEGFVFAFESNKFNMKCKVNWPFLYLYRLVDKDGACKQVKVLEEKSHKGFSIETMELSRRQKEEMTE